MAGRGFVLVATCSFLLSCSTSISTRLDSTLSEYFNSNAPGGAVIVIRDGAVLYKSAFGLADMETRTPNTSKTNFRLASLTKQFTAMAIMILADRGKLGYGQTLTDFFLDFPAVGKSITIRHLLTHTSGLVDYEDLMPETTTIPVHDHDVLNLLRQCDSTYYPPGSRFRYSNSGYSLLSLIVEKASGVKFAQFLKTNIFQPIGMGETVAFENGISTVSTRAYGFTPDSLNHFVFHPTDQSLTSSVLGDGGIYSSVEDLFRWDQALYTETLVSSKIMEEAFSPATVTADSLMSYGFGWFISEAGGKRRLHHSGTTVGFRNYIVRIPAQRTTVIVLMNRADGQPETLAKKILAEISK